MSAVKTPTFEEMMALFRETREQLAELAERSRQADERSRQAEERSRRLDERLDKSIADNKRSRKELDKRFAKLGDRFGELIESMVEGGIVRIFQELGYDFTCYGRRRKFKKPELNVSGEIDFFLENGNVACLVEVKSNLSEDDVRDHVEKMRKYRIYADAVHDHRQFIAAVGGGVVRDNVRLFALRQGMYVIQQTGDYVEVIPPEGKPKMW